MHWPSYLLGIATVVAMIALAALMARLAAAARRARSGGTYGRLSATARSTLEFAPRLIGKIRHSAEPAEDVAKAS